MKESREELASAGQGWVQFHCETGNGAIKITLRWPDTHPDTNNPLPLGGFLTICLTDPPQAPQDIDNDPSQVRSGDLIPVRGTGFGDDPDDLCLVIRLPNGQRIPVRVEDINQGEIVG